MVSKKRVCRYILGILVVLLPFFMGVLTLQHYGYILNDCKPVWGDELWWWKIAEAVSEYGSPLGYWGYNGGTPDIGTFATWGPSMVLPYGLFGMIFGWEFHSYIFANIFYMSLAALIYVLLTKANSKDMLMLCCANVCMVLRTFFTVTAMAECVRYSLGLIAVALLIYLYKDEVNRLVKYILIPIYLLYITQAYLIFGLFFLFYIYIIMDKLVWKWYLKLGISMCGMGILVLFSRKFLYLFTSPYPSKAVTLLEKINTNIAGVKGILADKGSFFAVFLIIYIIIMLCALLIPLFDSKMSKWDKELHIVSFFILSIFLGGHIVFYNTTYWTFIRGLSIALMIAVFILCLSSRKQCVVVYILATVLSLPTYRQVETTFFESDRYKTQEWEMTMNRYSTIFDEYLEVSEKAETPWENTVSTYYMKSVEDYPLVLPKGYGINTMLDSSVDIKSKYVLIGKMAKPDEYVPKLKELEQAGYQLIYDDDEMSILVSEDYTQN